MHFITYLAAVAGLSGLITAIPTPDGQLETSPGLRLIKTSEKDPGVWVTEEDKIAKYRAKKINFIDVTDIKDPDTLSRLSGASADDAARLAAVVYPTTVSHQTQANALIANANVAGPQSWLKTLSKYNNYFYSLILH